MLKHVIVAFSVVLLFAMSAQAMTAQEFLSHKAENRKAAMGVLGAAEAGGVPMLLFQAKTILSIAKTLSDTSIIAGANRAAFLHCAFAAHLIKTLPKGEQEKHGDVLIQMLGQLATALDMSEGEMLKTVQGASGVFDGILNGGKGEGQEQTPVSTLQNVQTYTSGGMLEELKASYLPEFPASKGYQTVGDAFNAYFEYPEWKIQDYVPTTYDYIWYAVTFEGVAVVGGRKAMFLASLGWSFDVQEKKLEFSSCNFMINGSPATPREEEEILVKIMMNSKQSRGNS